MSQPLSHFVIPAAPKTPYFTPAQETPAGAALNPQPNGKPIPKLFQPLKIRGVKFHNRIWLSPLAQYSAEDGKLTPWHMAHMGGIISRGPGLSFVEATAILPYGRTTPHDAGLWKDDQIESFRQIVEFAHSQNQKIGIQLVHGGRKSSSTAMWLPGAGKALPVVAGGFPNHVVAPSAVPYSETSYTPRELTKDEITEVVIGFADAARRAVTAGFDVIEIHGAHGFLITQFLSPVSNKRTDEYGGSFENRVRFALEVIDAIRAVIPRSMPLFFRMSATEWLEESLPGEPSWTIEDTKHFAPILAQHGVDLLDISSSGTSPLQKFNFNRTAVHSELSEQVKRAITGVKVSGTGEPFLVAVVGGISTGNIAAEVLDNEWADVVLAGRYFQQNPGLVWQFARDLDVEIQLPLQIGWAFKGRGTQLRQVETPERSN